MESTTVTVNVKTKIHTFQMNIITEYLPMNAGALKDRWFQYVGDKIKSVRRIRVTSIDPNYPGKPADRPWTPGFEVVFQNGAVGFVSDRGRGQQELDALIVGKKGYLHGLAVFKKYGRTVGTPVSWFRSKGKSPECRRSCAAELYALAAGEEWADLHKRISKGKEEG